MDWYTKNGYDLEYIERNIRIGFDSACPNGGNELFAVYRLAALEWFHNGVESGITKAMLEGKKQK